MIRRCAAALAAGLLVLGANAAPRLAAQSARRLPPPAIMGQAGFFSPGGDLFQDSILGGGSTQSSGFLFGAGVALPVTSRAEVHLHAGRGSSTVAGYGAAWEGLRGTSRLIMVTGRLAYRVTPEHWLGGVALLAGGGAVWQSFGDGTGQQLGPVASQTRRWPLLLGGVEGRLRVHEQFSLTLTVERLFYSAKFSTGSPASELAQRDTRAGIGIYLPLGFR